MAGKIDYVLHYLFVESYEDPELITANITKLRILLEVDSELTYQPSIPGIPHDVAVRVQHESVDPGNDQQLLWFDFMVLLKDEPLKESRLGTVQMELWVGLHPPAFYVVCFPSAPDYVAIVPNRVASKHQGYQASPASIPGPYLPYVLKVDQVPEALKRISKIHAGQKYINPGTQVVLESWSPPLQRLPVGIPAPSLEVVVPASGPSLSSPSRQIAGQKRRRSPSAGLEAIRPPPAARGTSTWPPVDRDLLAVVEPQAPWQQDGLAEQPLSGSGGQVLGCGDAPAALEDQHWGEWLGGAWLNNQPLLVDYIAPTAPQGISGLQGRQEGAQFVREDTPVAFEASVVPAGEPPLWNQPQGIWNGLDIPESSNSLVDLCGSAGQHPGLLFPVSTTHTSCLLPQLGPQMHGSQIEDSQSAILTQGPNHASLGQQLQPHLKVPAQQDEWIDPATKAPNSSVPDQHFVNTTPGLTIATPSSTRPLQDAGPQQQARKKTWLMIQLLSTHPWANHIFIPSTEMPPSPLELLLRPQTNCLLLLASYATDPYNEPTPLQSLTTQHPCLHLIKKKHEDGTETLYLTTSRDVSSYVSHLNAMKQGTLRSSSGAASSKSGLRGRNKQRTEFPTVQHLLDWCGSASLDQRNLHKVLETRYRVEMARKGKRPVGVLPGAEDDAVGTVGQVLQEQVRVEEF